jgi:23S rRNA pseudouridine1911/1915/1917 synthase
VTGPDDVRASDGATVSFSVESADAGERIDKLVARRVEHGGRRKLAELFERGAVRVGGRVAKKGSVAREGDAITVRLAPSIGAEPDAPLRVLLETPDVVIVDKPAGQPAVPARDGDSGTLASALLGHYPEMGRVGYRAREPGLLHRLDTGTSGLLVAARSAAAFATLRKALSAGHVEKRYLAVVAASGLPEDGVVDAPLAPDPDDGRRVVIVTGTPGPHHDAPDGARATPKIKAAPPAARVTRFRRLRVAGPWALVEIDARHAYRHQVRVHLASIGHPIAGDALYGGPIAALTGKRHALHASYVAWSGDDVVPAFAVESPLPDDLAALGFPR